jgi:hypothetical protein
MELMGFPISPITQEHKMGDSLGFRLNVSTGLDGIGFVNPVPLPDFDSSIERLHLIRRSEQFTNWNRISQVQGEIENSGVQLQANRGYSANVTQGLKIPDHDLDYDGGFTVAIAAQIPNVANNHALIRTSDYSDNSNRGFMLRLLSSGSDFGLQSRVHTDAGRASTTINSNNSPVSGTAFWIFASWNGTDLALSMPELSKSDSTALDTESDGNAPTPNSDLIIIGPNSGASPPTDITDVGVWAYAQWGRGLDVGEIAEEHAKLIAWGAGLGVPLL